jgi:cytochrome d ubiquinol oxidase subunit I
MELDLLVLSRLQFALTIMFHYLFPPLTIGLGMLMVIMEGMWLKTGNPVYEKIAYYWTRLFAVNFAMGVATGIVMEFQFGTNWATYSRFVGDVFGSALAAEGIFAFFLESGFLGVVVFGWNKVSPKFHYFATCMVCMGGFFSSIWIVIANSWMQTPAGYHLVEHGGRMRAEITDFWAMVFNPSAPDRLVHVWLGCFILGAFFALSISAWYLLKGRFPQESRVMFKVALGFAVVSSSAMGLSGDSNARMVAREQPIKLAALEGHWKTGTGGTGMYLWGWPDEKTETVKYGVEIPYLLSALVYHQLDKPVPGLDQAPKDERPNVVVTFWAYRIMIGCGVFFMALSWLALLVSWKSNVEKHPWLLKLCVFSVIPAYLANQAGWVAAEAGRQPWIVYKLLRTSDGLSASVPPSYVLASILMFGTVYALLFGVWVYVMNEKIQHGPHLPPPRRDSGSELTNLADAASRTVDPGHDLMGDD